MALELSIGGLMKLSSGLFETNLEPCEIRQLGSGPLSVGAVSILCLGRANVSSDATSVQFTPDAISVLNVGRTNRTLIVIDDYAPSVTDKSLAPMPHSLSEIQARRGDHAFVSALSQLPDSVRDAGIEILKGVRANFPGQLRAVSARRFQETPDSFWFVTIQPRDRSLVITVRGLPDHFGGRKLDIIADRSPYSRFKVRGLSDVAEAVDVILRALRR